MKVFTSDIYFAIGTFEIGSTCTQCPISRIPENRPARSAVCWSRGEDRVQEVTHEYDSFLIE